MDMDRKWIDQLALRVLDKAVEASGATWNRILTARAKSILWAVEHEMVICNRVADGHTCEECCAHQRHTCSPGLMAIRRAWKGEN